MIHFGTSSPAPELEPKQTITLIHFGSPVAEDSEEQA